MKKKPSVTTNEGIQARVVKGDVLAVGRGASAVKVTLGDSERSRLVDAIDRIESEVAALELKAKDREDVLAEVAQLKAAAQHGAGDTAEARGALQRVVEAFKQVGVIMTEAAGMAGPIRTIAGLLRVSLVTLGLA